MKHHEYFTSRWALLLAALGMCVGTGNIWRFPRMVAQNGGGAFVIAWMVFLFTWSIPLLIVEFSLGRKARLGVAGAVAAAAGPRFAWMGGFVALCTAAIMFYYSVVSGWCIKYLCLSVSGALVDVTHVEAVKRFNEFTSGVEPVLFHFAALAVVCFIACRGVVAGIERAAKILVPTLYVLLIVAAVRVLCLGNPGKVLRFLFCPEWSRLGDYRVWLQGLTQSAWSTGAGWGLLLTYAVYARQDHGPVRASFLAAFGNNLASLFAAIAIFGTICAVSPEQMDQVVGSGNTGLAFEWMPMLFGGLPGSRILTTIFFLALSFAAISSLISMVEMAVRVVHDFGVPRKRAILEVGIVAALLGLPSARKMSVLNNQDWVWSVGLMFSGFFIACAAICYGVSRFRRRLVNVVSDDWHVGRWFDVVILIFVPVEFVAMTVWWLAGSIRGDRNWWRPFGEYTFGTCLLQIGGAIVLLALVNKWLRTRVPRPRR